MPDSIDADALQRLIAYSSPLLVEVLDSEEYSWAHLRGAINVPLDEISAELPDAIDASRPIVVYCNDFL